MSLVDNTLRKAGLPDNPSLSQITRARKKLRRRSGKDKDELARLKKGRTDFIQGALKRTDRNIADKMLARNFRAQHKQRKKIGTNQKAIITIRKLERIKKRQRLNAGVQGGTQSGGPFAPATTPTGILNVPRQQRRGRRVQGTDIAFDPLARAGNSFRTPKNFMVTEKRLRNFFG